LNGALAAHRRRSGEPGPARPVRDAGGFQQPASERYGRASSSSR